MAAFIGNVLAWTATGLLTLWILFDFTRTNMKYDEEYLTTSQEGVDEFAEVEQAIARSESAADPLTARGQDRR